MKGRQVWAMAVLAGAGLFFCLSDPSKVPSFALIIGFGLLLAVLFQIVFGLLTVGSWYGLLPEKRARRRLTAVITGLTGSLVALQSIGELSNRDVVVLIPLMVGAYLYSYAARTE